MTRNPILDEIHEVREQIISEFHGDLNAYVEDARKRVLASGRPIAVPQPRNGAEPGTKSPIVQAPAGHQ